MNNQDIDRIENAASRYSEPTKLEIIDLRTAVICSNYDYPILRIDTNQGVYGLGEVRDAGHREEALRFKGLLLGKNPCNVDMIMRTLKQFGGPGRQGGGVSGVEIALWDLVGKVYGVPCYQFLGGTYRDRVRIYADTPEPRSATPEGYAEAVLERKRRGMTMVKFDLGIDLLQDRPGALVGETSRHERRMLHRHARDASGLAGNQITDEGLAYLVEIMTTCREAVGWDVPLAIDHLGPISAKDAIRLGRALEPLSVAWLEDVLPWWDVAGNKRITESVPVPTLHGEDLYLLEGFRQMIDERAVDIIQPDLLTAGGMIETKRIADYAEKRGIPSALHCAGSPIGFMASVHTALALSSFVALESHWLDLPFWKDLVTGLPEPFIRAGYVDAPQAPGLGVDLNYEALEANLRGGGLFEPTDDWNSPKVGFWQPEGPWTEWTPFDNEDA